jgi:hypothetical protein
MEKKEAIREWCLEKAIVVCNTNRDVLKGKLKPAEIIAVAEEFEKYVQS